MKKKRIISALLALVMGIGCVGFTACEDAAESSSTESSSSVEEKEEIEIFYFAEKRVEFPVGAAY